MYKKLEKEDVIINKKEAIKALNKVNIFSEGFISDAYKERIGKMKYNTMKQFEDDFYELNLRARNLEEEDDALYVMRQINTRISIIDEYITGEKLDSGDRNRWLKIISKYKELREKISNNHIYKNKSLGIFVQYPDIIENRY